MSLLRQVARCLKRILAIPTSPLFLSIDSGLAGDSASLSRRICHLEDLQAEMNLRGMQLKSHWNSQFDLGVRQLLSPTERPKAVATFASLQQTDLAKTAAFYINLSVAHASVNNQRASKRARMTATQKLKDGSLPKGSPLYTTLRDRIGHFK